MKRIIAATSALLVLAGCSQSSIERTQSSQPVVLQQPANLNAAGVVNYVWEEPMVDVINVPPGLDPEGHYYRPGHQEVIENRQGRWQYYRPQGN